MASGISVISQTGPMRLSLPPNLSRILCGVSESAFGLGVCKRLPESTTPPSPPVNSFWRPSGRILGGRGLANLRGLLCSEASGGPGVWLLPFSHGDCP